MPQLLPQRIGLRNPLLDEDDPFANVDQPQPDAFDLAGLTAPASAPAQPNMPQPSPITEGPRARKYRELVEQGAPTPSKKPNAWQKIGAIATGAASGWYNAANPRSQPIDTSETIEGILYPGQKRKQQQYDQDLKSAATQADFEGETAYNTARIGELGARTVAERERANAEAAKAGRESQTADQKYAELLKVPGMTPDIARSVATTGKFPERTPMRTIGEIEAGLIDTIQQSQPDSPEDKQARELLTLLTGHTGQPAQATTPASPLAQIAQIRARTDLTDEQKNAAVEQVKADAAAVARAQHIPSGNGDRGNEFTPAQQAGVERRKDSEMQDSSAQLEEDIESILTKGDPESGNKYPRNAEEYAKTFAKIRAKFTAHRQRSQQAQNNYEKDIQMRTGRPVSHLEFPSVEEMMTQWGFEAPAQAQPKEQPQPSTPQAIKSGQVVDGHRFKGGDPNKQENWEPVSR